MDYVCGAVDEDSTRTLEGFIVRTSNADVLIWKYSILILLVVIIYIYMNIFIVFEVFKIFKICIGFCV